MYKSVSMDEFKQVQRSKDITIIDVREANEFTAGHIPKAINIPLSGLTQEHDKLEENKEYHVICLSGRRLLRACDFLGSKGIDVVNVEGGMSAWREANEQDEM